MPTTYAVIQPTLNQSDPAWVNSGPTISRHRSIEAAQATIDKANRQLRAQPGQQNSWVDWHVVEAERVEGGRWSYSPLPSGWEEEA